MKVVAASVAGVAVIADPAKRRSRVVLRGLGPPREIIDVLPRSAGTRHEVDGQAERVFTVRRVPGGRVAGRHHDVEPGDEPGDVRDQPLVDGLAWLARNGDDASPTE